MDAKGACSQAKLLEWDLTQQEALLQSTGRRVRGARIAGWAQRVSFLYPPCMHLSKG